MLSSSSTLRSTKIRAAPSSANRSAVAPPMPPPAPVTNAVFPVNLFIDFSHHSLSCISSVEVERGPRHVARCAAGEEDDGTPDLGDRAEATQGNLAQDALGELGVICDQRRHVGKEIAWRKCVHPDVQGSELECEGTGESFDTSLTRAICRLPFDGCGSGHRGQVDH